MPTSLQKELKSFTSWHLTPLGVWPGASFVNNLKPSDGTDKEVDLPETEGQAGRRLCLFQNGDWSIAGAW